MTENLQIVTALADIGTTGILLVIMWQGLKRFDALLNVVINLALLNSDKPELREQAARKLHDATNGR
jgi:hypothetical protein